MRPLKLRARRLQALGIEKIQPTVVRMFPHDSEAFTQGLFLYGDTLYESTGLIGRSSLREIDKGSGELQRVIPVEDLFCEGIARLANRLYQLTWRTKVVLVYDFPGLSRVGTLPLDGQGWGLTSDRSNLILSNGSSIIEYRGADLELVMSQRITLNGLPLSQINDLAVNGDTLYLNVYRQPYIYVADLKSGCVRQIIDLSEIAAKEASAVPAAAEHKENVMLNGIAIDREQAVAYVTGKLWSHFYVIRLANR